MGTRERDVEPDGRVGGDESAAPVHHAGRPRPLEVNAPAATETVQLALEGMTCAACAARTGVPAFRQAVEDAGYDVA